MSDASRESLSFRTGFDSRPLTHYGASGTLYGTALGGAGE
jgi:hypothetical protein